LSPKIQLGVHSQLAAVSSTYVCVGNIFFLEVIYEFDSYTPQTSRQGQMISNSWSIIRSIGILYCVPTISEIMYIAQSQVLSEINPNKINLLQSDRNLSEKENIVLDFRKLILLIQSLSHF